MISLILVSKQSAACRSLREYLGTDPEMSSRNSSYYRGVDNGQIPFGRSFNVGVSINL